MSTFHCRIPFSDISNLYTDRRHYKHLGTLSPYITSYFYSKDDSISSSSLIQISLISYVTGAITVLFLPSLSKTFPATCILAVPSITSGICLYFTSYILNPHTFAWAFGLTIGFFSAFTFIPAIWIAIEVIPQNKASIMEMGLCSYAMAPSIYGFFFILLVNPFDKSPQGEPKYFSNEVNNKVPESLQYLSGIFTITALAGSLLMAKFKKITLETTANHTFLIGQVLCQGKFWYLFTYLLTKGSMFYYLINVYKNIAFLFIDNDYFVACLGSARFVAAGLGRVFVGTYLISSLEKELF